MSTPEIRYDRMADRALFELLDGESARRLFRLAGAWAKNNATRLRPALRRAWLALAALRAGPPAQASTVRVYSERPNVRAVDRAPAVRPAAIVPVGQPDPELPAFPLVRRLKPAFGRWPGSGGTNLSV